ncbi:MAG: ABC transporter ATP-binding protein [Bacteroidales bacterium]|nr:ABC transporter ATP-binding protein [Bacteroidales bacterium]MBQ1886399.1 ABC transporter ATP-binding protein [Bacteroidales bacterium]MBR2135590.1 ABC transporter ATP-binding protein [Bacteroidales bacterium]
MIRSDNITKAFGTHEVLKGLSFNASQGEVLSIVGASGAGKTTLLQILGTILYPDSGSVVIDGVDVFSLDAKALSAFRNQKIGFVFQFHHLLPEFTAVENIMLPALIGRYEGASSQRLTDSQIRTRAEELLKELGLKGKEGSRPSELSGGEQQRVAIARAMINQPKIIFADEPSGNLDSRTKQELHDLFFKMRDNHGQTIVIVTHDEQLASRCDRSLTLKDGVFI